MGSQDYDELIVDTLAMVNVVRQAFGKDQLVELPDAVPGNAADCLFYRAFGDIGVTGVSGSTMSFASDRIASVVGELWGTSYQGQTVTAPEQFRKVIGAFDDHRLSHYDV